MKTILKVDFTFPDLFLSRLLIVPQGLQKLRPAYVIPTHCTGRKAIMAMEKKMPDQFILNMAGTKLTFA